MSGITPRQLQWLDDKGILKPDHVGRNRVYDTHHALLMMIVGQMRAKGMKLAYVRAALPNINRDLKRNKNKAIAYLLLGVKTYLGLFGNVHAVLWALTDTVKQPCWIVDVARIYDLLAADSTVGTAAAGER